MAELYDEKGEVVEGAMTQDEITEQTEKLEKEKEELLEEKETEYTESKKELEEKITEMEEEMEKFGKKDLNFGKLRKQKEANEEILQKVEEKFKGEIEDIKKNIGENKFEVVFKNVVGEQETETEKKIKEHYNSFEGAPKDRDEMVSRIKNSYLLATGDQLTSPLNSGVIGTGTGSHPKVKGTEGKITDDGKDLAGRLGIKEDELKKNKLI